MAVISNKDVSKVLDAITKEGFSSSRISTTGQFLADGHTTLFIGTEDHKVDQLFDVLKKHVTKRVVLMITVVARAIAMTRLTPTMSPKPAMMSFMS